MDLKRLSEEQKNDFLEKYNIVWDSPSRNSSGTMPVGGHDIGLNVWVEEGDLLFYIDRSGSFDENNQMLKLGRVRVKLTPNPFNDNISFRQELKLLEGCIEIEASNQNGFEAKIILWVEVFRPKANIEIQANQPVEVEAIYENWRMEEREIPINRRMASLSYVGYPGKVSTKPDSVSFEEDHVMFYHRNQDDSLLFDKLVDQQGLSQIKDELWNPQLHLTFGGLLSGSNMVPNGITEGVYGQIPYRGWGIRSSALSEQHHISLCFHTGQTDTIEEWKELVVALKNQTFPDVEHARQSAKAWWADFWSRSYIQIMPDQPQTSSKPWQVGRNYQLFRYMLGCNAYGGYPTKFNGGLFTSDPCHVMPEANFETETPDFRYWGGGSMTAQNQRLVYWPMLKSGDFEMMPPQFKYYSQALSNAEQRTKVYWGHEGCSFTEQVENFGLPIGMGWGWKDSDDKKHLRTDYSDPTELIDPWIRYLYVNQLEFSFMIIKYYQYSRRDIMEYIPFIESSIRFIDVHYQYRHFLNTARQLDENGYLVFFPSTACETYKNATNPADLIAAMEATVQAVLTLPDQYINTESRLYYEGLLDRIPPLPYRDMQGKKTIAPAQYWTEIINTEIPQLYPVFPYEQYGVGKEDLQVVIDTWHYGVEKDHQKDHVSWHQDNIFCARMGLTDEAVEYAIRKLEDGDHRFPAFWGPGHDWLPDHNWGGSGMIGLQDMLMHTNGENIYLFPAWPRAWDVDFKLHAPLNTLVEGKAREGKLLELKVTPESRRSDVVNMWEKNQ